MSYVAGIDFGTTNSSAAISNGEKTVMVQLEQSFETIPTAIYFSNNKPEIYFGRDALYNAIDNEILSGFGEKEDSGRFMRSIKRALGTSLMNQGTVIKGQWITFDKIIGLFIKNIKTRIDLAADEDVESIVMGRPVHFVDNDPEGDVRAESELKQICLDVGFKNVEFQYEPIAAAFAHERDLLEEHLALVIDVGGGTSDFTLIRIGGSLKDKINREEDILANTGVRIGGNDFDKNLSLCKFMPEFGKDTMYGGQTLLEPVLAVPVGHFYDLSDWGRVNSLYTYKNINIIKRYLQLAHEKEKYQRLLDVVENQLGHKVLTAIEKIKIALTDSSYKKIKFDFLANSPEFIIKQFELEGSIEPLVSKIVDAAIDCVKLAGVKQEDISLIVLAGGSTEIPYVQKSLCKYFKKAHVSSKNKMSCVGLGLAYDALRRFKRY